MDAWDCGFGKTASVWNVPGKYGPHGELYFFLIEVEPLVLTKAMEFRPLAAAEILKACALIGLHLLAEEDASVSRGSLSPDFGDMWRYGCPKKS